MLRCLRRDSSFYIPALLVLAASCGGSGHADRGVLVVPFELGNRRTCEALGVVSVRAELDEGTLSQEASCDAGKIRFDQLKPGSYDVSVYGLDKDGKAVMDSLNHGALAVDVVGGGTTVVVDPAVTLSAAPVKLLMRWMLGFGSCKSTTIATFGIAAWRSDGSEMLMESEIGCEVSGEGAGQYRVVPDEKRQLSGEALGEIEVQPYDANGTVVGDPVTFKFDSPGAGGTVKLSLACDPGGCTGSGAPD